MGQLRDFAMMEEADTVYSGPGYSKNGKEIYGPQEVHVPQKWGVWLSGTGYMNSRNIAQVSFGIDYRLAPHWLVGALATYWQDRGGFAQGGGYTAFYEKGFYGVGGFLLGVNSYTLFASTGYDFRVGRFGFGPIESIQWDDQTVNSSFGRGQLFQNRLGARAFYLFNRFSPEVQVQWQNQTQDADPLRRNAVYAEAGLSYLINVRTSIYGAYSIEANSNYQINQVDLGLRIGF
jgi:hypothetical protein